MATNVEDLYALVTAGDADATVTRLETRLPPEDIEVRPPEPGRYRRLDERLREDATGAGKAALVGAVLGAVVGVGVGLATGAGPAVVIMVAFGFAAFAALIGGMIGLQRREPEDDDPAVDLVVEEPEGLRLVVVRAPHERDWARRVLEKEFGAWPLEHDTPLADDEDPAPEAQVVPSEEG